MPTPLGSKSRQELTKLMRALRLVWQSSKGWTAAWIVMLVVQGLLPAASVYLIKLLVDALVAAMAPGSDPAHYRALVVYAVLMASVLLATQLIQQVLSWIRLAQSEHASDHIRAIIHEKAVEVDYAFYETPRYFDRLHRAISDAGSKPLALLESLGLFVRNTITLLAMAAIILPYGWWLPVVLVVSTVPAFLVILVYNRKTHAWWEQKTTDRRWAHYFDTVLTHSSMAAEVRLFDLGARYSELYQGLREVLRNERLSIEKRNVLARTGAALVGLIVLAFAMGWMGLRALRGAATLGDVALFYQAFNQGQQLLKGLLGSVGQIYNSSLFLDNLFDFLDQEAEITSGEGIPFPAKVETVEFRDVTFFYPDATAPALQQFNLTLHAGNVTAVVGENGAGKSTVLKLLCRFYDPQEGQVLINGKDIRSFDLRGLRDAVAVLFQFPVNFHATVEESIKIGRLIKTDSMADVQSAASISGADEFISRLPGQYKTLLGKWFVDGHELSGGEWQRLAMARAIYRDAAIVVLDEPTSMMDSWSEADWFNRLLGYSREKTLCLITHRLTIARRAETIVVMHRGSIVERGTHDELIARQGRYAESWIEQHSDQVESSSAVSARPREL